MVIHQDLTKYNTSSRICGIIMSELINKIKNNEILNVKELGEYGDMRIVEECNKIYKKETVKCIAFPTSISLNDCVGNYLYETSQEFENYNTIKKGDVVKIELGVNLSGCIANLGETVIYDDSTDTVSNEKHIRYLQLLEILKRDILELIKVGEINDEIKINIESKCTEYGCFPVENTISYQHLDGQMKSFESKYIICNYQKYYDQDDNLVGEENLCFEFEEGEVYTINLRIIPNDNERLDETTHMYKELHEPHIYRFNDTFYNLKLKSSREFYSLAKGKHGTNAFNCLQYKTDYKHRIGIKESYENCILDSYPVMYSKDKYPVYHKKFTILVGKDKTIVLKYN